MQAQAWSRLSTPVVQAPTCRRCGRGTHLISDDGPAVCRVCLFAWVHYAAVVSQGPVIQEMGVAQLRHADHDVLVQGCRFCRTAHLAVALPFDAWLRGHGG